MTFLVVRRRLSSSAKEFALVTLLLAQNCIGSFVVLPSGQPKATSGTLLRAHQGKESVAVIGGGIAGLSCAVALSESGKFEPTVFDTGRLRPGGRCSSRLPGDLPKDPSERHDVLKNVVVDHAAQILTVPPGYEDFEKQVHAWEEQGVIQRFPPGSVCDISKTKVDAKDSFRLKPLNNDKNVMYYGVDGMGSIPMAMASGKKFDVEQDVWVSPNNGVRYERDEKWKVKGNGKNLGTFDKLVIAHNGKCADRLMSRTPAKALHSLLRTNFSPSVPAWGGKRMTLNSIYSLTFCVKSQSPISKALSDEQFISGFVKNEPVLRFLSCNTRKYGNDDKEDYEVWTVLSSAKFAKKHKAPQEFLPEEVVSDVTGLLLEAIERSLSLEPGALRGPEDGPPGAGIVIDSRLQLWGAAVPLNTWSTERNDNAFEKPNGFLYDAEHGVGACGDWLLEPSIAGAWESGRRLAEWMATEQDASVGLPPNGAFQQAKAVAKEGIGALR